MNKRILVHTDDPQNKKFYLTVAGKVDPVVDINPGTVSLSGAPGEELSAVVTITPAEKYDFKILEMKQKFNTQIKAELVPPEAGSRVWRVKIKTQSDKADDLYDIISFKTDSPFKPKFKVRVYAIYFEKTNNDS
jgi:hypothetical protein